MSRIEILGWLLVTSLGGSLHAQLPTVTDRDSQFIFTEPVTASCHASTIEEVRPGRLLAAWFGGSREGGKDVGIYLSEHTNGTWSPPRRVIDPLVTKGDTLPCWNPVLYRSRRGELYLFYKVGKNPREWFGALRTSPDDGQSWSTATYLPDGILGPVRNKPIELEEGIILCGSSTEDPLDNTWRVHLERYTEATGTWERIPVPNPARLEAIQPTLLRHGIDTVQILCRSKHGKLAESWSTDGGDSWSPLDTTTIVNSNSGVDAVALASGGYLLVNNPLTPGRDWWNGRNVLDLSYSPDGEAWHPLLDLERHAEGEYSYPAIIQAGDGRVHISYTFDRRYIKHVSFLVK
jgi:predicted neuraminidase